MELTTADVAHGGWCVARPASGPVVFVRHALPGERVLARITDVTSRLARAEAVEILDRVPRPGHPALPARGPGGCGGCDWQHAALPAQRALKAAVVRQQLKRLAGIEREVEVEALPGDEGAGDAHGEDRVAGGTSPDGHPAAWLARVEFAVREDGVAGLRAHRSHEVIEIAECLIAHRAITGLDITGRGGRARPRSRPWSLRPRASGP